LFRLKGLLVKFRTRWRAFSVFIFVVLTAGSIYFVRVFWPVSGAFNGGGFFSCSYDEKSRLESPDSSRNATVLQGSCGATTGITTRVTIESKNGSAPLVEIARFQGQDIVRLRWVDANQLEVRCATAAPTQEVNQKIFGLDVIFIGCV
jgi:hypothetical protein